MRSEPDFAAYNERLANAYDSLNYGRSLSSWFMRRGHALLEQPFGPERRFSKLVEVGAGAGEQQGGGLAAGEAQRHGTSGQPAGAFLFPNQFNSRHSRNRERAR